MRLQVGEAGVDGTGADSEGAPARAHRLVIAIQPLAAALVVLAFLLPQGVGAAALAAPWLALALLAALSGALPLLQHRWTMPLLGRAGALAFLAVGAGWLLLSRLGARPLDFSPAIVELTGVHFHYAGFASATIATWAYLAMDGARRRAAGAVLIALLAGPLLTAAGFTFSPFLQVLGAVVLTLALWTLAALTIELVVSGDHERATRALLGVSALAVLAPMALAVQWAAAQQLPIGALSIPDMALIHGTANALGFALLGLLGWRRAADSVPRLRAASPSS